MITEAPPSSMLTSHLTAPSRSTRGGGGWGSHSALTPPMINQLPIWGVWGLCRPPPGASAVTFVSGSSWEPCAPDGPSCPGWPHRGDDVSPVQWERVQGTGRVRSAWLTACAFAVWAGTCCDLREHLCTPHNRGLNNKCFDDCMCVEGEPDIGGSLGAETSQPPFLLQAGVGGEGGGRTPGGLKTRAGAASLGAHNL